MNFEVYYLKAYSGDTCVAKILEKMLNNNIMKMISVSAMDAVSISPHNMKFFQPYFYENNVLYRIFKGTCRETLINSIVDSRNYALTWNNTPSFDNTRPYERNITILKLSFAYPKGVKGITKENLQESLPQFLKLMHHYIDRSISDQGKHYIKTDKWNNELQFNITDSSIQVVYPIEFFAGFNQKYIFHSLFLLLLKSFLWVTPTGKMKNLSTIFTHWRSAIKKGSFDNKIFPHVRAYEQLLKKGNFIMFTFLLFGVYSNLSLNKHVQPQVYISGPIAFFNKYFDKLVKIFDDNKLWYYFDEYIDLNDLDILRQLPESFTTGLIKYRKLQIKKNPGFAVENLDGILE